MSKLTPDEKSLVLRLRAEDHTFQGIQKILKEDYEKAVGWQWIQKICGQKSVQEEFRSYRTSYLKNIMAVPVANKRTRLEKLQRLVGKLEHKIYASEHINSRVLTMMKRLLDTLNSAMTEVEGKPALMEFYQYHDYGSLKDEDLTKEREDTIERILSLRKQIEQFRGPPQPGGEKALPADPGPE